MMKSLWLCFSSIDFSIFLMCLFSKPQQEKPCFAAHCPEMLGEVNFGPSFRFTRWNSKRTNYRIYGFKIQAWPKATQKYPSTSEPCRNLMMTNPIVLGSMSPL
jgi:hypothetical protein